MEDKKKTKINLKIILTIILVVAIAIVIYVMNKPKEIANIKYDIKIAFVKGHQDLTGWATNNEYVLVNIKDEKAYFIQEHIVWGDSTGKENGTTVKVINEEKISGNTFDMIIGLTERNSDYDEKSFSNYYEVEYKGKTIQLTATPLLDSIFNSIKE